MNEKVSGIIKRYIIEIEAKDSDCAERLFNIIEKFLSQNVDGYLIKWFKFGEE